MEKILLIFKRVSKRTNTLTKFCFCPVTKNIPAVKSVTLTWLKINIFKIHICYSKEKMFRNNFSWGEKQVTPGTRTKAPCEYKGTAKKCFNTKIEIKIKNNSIERLALSDIRHTLLLLFRTTKKLCCFKFSCNYRRVEEFLSTWSSGSLKYQARMCDIGHRCHRHKLAPGGSP